MQFEHALFITTFCSIRKGEKSSFFTSRTCYCCYCRACYFN
uniref:Uncharacterized protein n=1 Tax=Anguilla anguilla TaxID=7936 RepID=A0A0E9TI54_ANGAN